MQVIQENEIQQLRELTLFFDLELHFAKQYYEVLQDVKANWCDEYVVPSQPGSSL